MTTAPALSKPTPRKVSAPKRPPMPLPTTAAELLSLDAAALNAVFIEARLRLAAPGRRWLIAFDAEAKPSTAAKVGAAAGALARTLRRAGGRPEIARLPLLPGTDKTGLDDLLAADKIDEQKVAVLKAEIAELGGLLCTVQTRRGHLRREARRALGRPIERNEAIASAVDTVLNGHLHAAVMAEADRLQKQALADLEAAPEAA